MWISETKGSKFWIQVLSELQMRGMQVYYTASIDGLKGFP